MSSFDDPNYFTNTMYPYSYDPNHLAPTQEYMARPRHSISSTSDIFPLLSPSSHAAPSLHQSSGSSQSPRSSASPHSNGYYENNSVSENELNDLLDMSGEMNFDFDQKPQMINGNIQPQNLFLPNSGFGTMGGGSGGGGFDFGKLQADQLAAMLFQQQQQQTMAPQWMQNQQEVMKQQQQAQFSHIPQNLFDFQNAKPLPTDSTTLPTKTKPVTKAATRRGPKAKDNDENAPLGPSGGKHNKTERRYRQKVQAAQTELRDSVPALRVLYGTSTEEQRQTTDIKMADGSVDGLGEITRPNASAKTTIFVGAKLYIELLQERVAGLQRQVEELENYRSAVGGQEDLDSWKADFNQREKQRREMKELADQLRQADESGTDLEDDDEEEEEVVVKRKKARKTPVKKEDSSSTVVRTFAAFAMTFSFLPSAGETFTSIPVDSSLPFTNPTTGEVISRLPIITAEHASRLLARGLPSSSVPHPTTLVEWGWRILVAVLVAAVLGPIFRRLSRMTQPGLSTTVKEAGKYALRVEGRTNPATLTYAAGIVGGIVSPSRLSYWYTIMHLNRTCSDSHTLAILALLQPKIRFLPSAESLWKLARASIDESTPSSLVAVLDTPLSEAAQYLYLPTSDPIGSIADQLNLVHLNDLYTRMFTKLVLASTNQNGPLPNSTSALLENLDKATVGKDLRSSSFDREIRSTIQSTAKGTPSHALGLVLIGLWGIFTGPTASSQAALVSALAAEEMQGAGLSSTSAMLNLLYPGSSNATPVTTNGNAAAIDRLALVCIEYLRLLLSSTSVSKSERLEHSKQIGRVSNNLRLALTQTEFVGLKGVERDDEAFIGAKERLVGVLSALGRRARGRVVSSGIDSGLEAEVDEL